MKKTLISIASLLTVISFSANAKEDGLSASAEIIENGSAVLIDKRTRVKLYPEISIGDSLRGSGISVVEQPKTHSVTTNSVISISETITHTETINNPVNVGQNNNVPDVVVVEPKIKDVEDNIVVKRTGDFTTTKKDGFTEEKKEIVYTKTFLGIPYAPVEVVVEEAKPIYLGKLHFNNLSCTNQLNSGSIDLYGQVTTTLMPILFCPSGNTVNVELAIETSESDPNNLTILLGGQKIKVEKGFTTLYNLRYDQNHVSNFEFIYVVDEHPVRY